MRVEWLEKALKHLEDEASYIALENPKAADDFLMQSLQVSTDWPNSSDGP